MTYTVGTKSATQDGLRKIQELLGIQRQQREPIEPAQLIANGIPVSAICRIKQVIGLSDQQIAQTVGISRRTLYRRLQQATIDTQKRLTPSESDRLYRLARVVARATEVFGDEIEAQHWLSEPQRALQGQTPLEIIQTDPGVQQVDVLLGRIEHGIFA